MHGEELRNNAIQKVNEWWECGADSILFSTRECALPRATEVLSCVYWQCYVGEHPLLEAGQATRYITRES